MLTVCLLGQPYWVARLETSVSAYCAGDLRLFKLVPNARTFVSALRAATHADVLIRIGFRPGGATPRGRLLDACWSVLRTLNRRACAVYYWIGSDVLTTVRDIHSGAIRRSVFDRAKFDMHLAESAWLAAELRGVGIHANVIRFPVAVVRTDGPLPLPERFTVLTHVPDFRFRFYGGESIYEAARALPRADFEVVAGKGTWIPGPLTNLRFHGWQSDMAGWYRRASVVVRMVEHDGLGLTIQEALSFGRHAVYSYPLPYTHYVRFGDTAGLVECLDGLMHRHDLNLLLPNKRGWEYAVREFNEAKDTKMLTSYLEHLVTRMNVSHQQYA
jgi:hypothetical protein